MFIDYLHVHGWNIFENTYTYYSVQDKNKHFKTACELNTGRSIFFIPFNRSTYFCGTLTEKKILDS